MNDKMIMDNEKKIQLLREKFLNAYWPKCDEIADEILSIDNIIAKEIFVEALKIGKRHHIRTAAIRALVKFNDESLVKYIEPLLNDSAYDARIEAKKAIKILTGKVVLTSKGE